MKRNKTKSVGRDKPQKRAKKSNYLVQRQEARDREGKNRRGGKQKIMKRTNKTGKKGKTEKKRAKRPEGTGKKVVQDVHTKKAKSSRYEATRERDDTKQ